MWWWWRGDGRFTTFPRFTISYKTWFVVECISIIYNIWSRGWWWSIGAKEIMGITKIVLTNWWGKSQTFQTSCNNNIWHLTKDTRTNKVSTNTKKPMTPLSNLATIWTCNNLGFVHNCLVQRTWGMGFPWADNWWSFILKIFVVVKNKRTKIRVYGYFVMVFKLGVFAFQMKNQFYFYGLGLCISIGAFGFSYRTLYWISNLRL
jgi:hypothetical protein